MLKMSCFFSNRLKSSLTLWMIHLAFLCWIQPTESCRFCKRKVSPFSIQTKPSTTGRAPKQVQKGVPFALMHFVHLETWLKSEVFQMQNPHKDSFQRGKDPLKFHKGWRIPMKIDMKIESIYIFISNHLPTNSQTWTSMPPGLPEGKVSHM